MIDNNSGLFTFHLSSQFLIVTLILAVLLSVPAALVFKYIETSWLTEELNTSGEKTLKSVSKNSTYDIESNNVNALSEFSKQILGSMDEMYRVQFFDLSGNVLLDTIKPKQGSRDNVVSVSRLVIGPEGNIGKVALFWELDRRIAEINRNARTVAIYSFAILVVAFSAFLAVANWLILKPVRKIESQLKSISSAKDTKPLKFHKFKAIELHHLGDAVNKLGALLESQKDKETSLIEAKGKLERIERQLIQAIEAVNDGFVYYTADDKLAVCNEKYKEIYAESADLFVAGNSFENIIRTGAERGQYEDAIGRVDDWVEDRMYKHNNPLGPIEQKLPNGRWVRIVETRSEDGGLVGIRTDITKFKKNQEELKLAKDAAEAANAAKSDFLAMMSHEIRTPLNGVLGILGLLDDVETVEEHQKLIAVAQDSATTLLTIINDILDFSKLEAGKVELEITSFNPSVAFSSIIDLLRPTALSKGIYLEFTGPKDSDTRLYGDASKLRQIILNLVGNAIKFTSDGGVLVRVDVKDGDGDRKILVAKITDTGVGIDAVKHDVIFGKFITVDASYTRKLGGTGLGLAIAKGLTQMMGGKIGFDSKQGTGSTFWFKIPLAEAPAEDVPSIPVKEDHEIGLTFKPRILVVEDNAANQMVARKTLEKLGCKVDTAGNGIEGVSACSKFHFDLILMDISMPEMDGISAAKKIRKISGTNHKIPIIAMTAHALKGEKEQFMQAGMDDYLQKPAPANDLRRMIKKWVNSGEEKARLEKKTDSSKVCLDHQVLHVLSKETGVDGFADLLQCFIDDTFSRKNEIVSALDVKDCAVLRSQAHALGSSAATFGALELHNICREIEQLLRENNQNSAFNMALNLEIKIDNTLLELQNYKAGLVN